LLDLNNEPTRKTGPSVIFKVIEASRTEAIVDQGIEDHKLGCIAEKNRDKSKNLNLI
jgi:hypothetical protein